MSPSPFYPFAFGVLLMVSGLTAPAVAVQDRPNVIFFAFDDLCDWISPMGYDQAITPNLDRLARQGVTFTNAHTAGTYCSPSRAAIFTGRHATTTGVYRTQVYFRDHPELTPLQQSFHNAGYHTFGGGKLFHHPEGFMDRRGWTEFFVRNESQKNEGWPLDSWGEDTPIPDPFPASKYNEGKTQVSGLFLEYGSIPNDREEDMADTKRINWACSVLERSHDAPFFLGVGVYAPHFPNYAPQKYFDRYRREEIELPIYKEDDLDDLPEIIRKPKTARKNRHHKRLSELGIIDEAILGYLASVSYADAMLGRVLDALAQSPYRDNTIVVIWSDHGYHHGEKGDWGKHTLWERTSNVPFIWAGPGVASDQKIETTVSLIDMYPTFVELCGLAEDLGLEGESLASVLAYPDSAKDRDVFLPFLRPNAYAVINRDWRYIRYDDGSEELYNLHLDPHEWENLALNPDYDAIKTRLEKSAPRDHAPPGRDRPSLELVTQGETFHWVEK